MNRGSLGLRGKSKSMVVDLPSYYMSLEGIVSNYNITAEEVKKGIKEKSLPLRYRFTKGNLFFQPENVLNVLSHLLKEESKESVVEEVNGDIAEVVAEVVGETTIEVCGEEIINE